MPLAHCLPVDYLIEDNLIDSAQPLFHALLTDARAPVLLLELFADPTQGNPSSSPGYSSCFFCRNLGASRLMADQCAELSRLHSIREGELRRLCGTEAEWIRGDLGGHKFRRRFLGGFQFLDEWS